MNIRINLDKIAEAFLALGQIAFFVLLIFTPFAYGTVEIWSQMVSHGLVYLVILCWLCGKLIAGDHAFSISWVVGLLALLLLWSVVSTLWISIYQYNSYLYLLRISDYLLVALYVTNQFTDERSRLWLFCTIAVVGTMVAAYGLINYFLRPAIFAVHAPAGGVGATAPYVNHNHFAGYLEMALPVTAGLFLATYRKVRVEASLLLLFLSVFLLLGLLFSLSRAGIISFLTVAALVSLWVLLKKSNRKIIAPAIVLSLVAVGYLSFLETERVERRLRTLGEEQTILTMNGRTFAWKASASAIKDQPWAGYGPGNFRLAVTPYREPGFRQRFEYAHNDYLQLWLEYGLFGLVLALAGIILYARKLARAVRRKSAELDYLQLGIGAGILSLLLHSFFDFNLNLHANALLFIVLLSLFAGRSSAVASLRRARALGSLGFALPLILIVAGLSFTVPSLKADILKRQAVQLSEDASPFEKIALYNQVRFLVPSNAEYSFGLAHCYVLAARSGEVPYFYSKALENFDRALKLSPASSEFWLGRAFVEAEVGHNSEAESSFEQVIAHDPQNPAGYFYLSDYYLATGKVAPAIASSRKGIELAPQFFTNRLRKIWQLSQDVGQLSALVPESHNSCYYELAYHLYRNKLYSEAIAQLERCDCETAWERNWFYLMGQSQLALGELDSAEYFFRLGIKSKPDKMHNYRRLAMLLRGARRDEEVEALFKNAINRPLVTDKAPLLYEYALHFARKRDYLSQRRQISKALKGDLNNPVYLELLADSYMGEARYFEALKELKRIEALNGKRLSVLRKIATIYERLGQNSSAHSYCEKILQTAPADSWATGMLERLQAVKEGNAEGDAGV